MAKEKNSSHVMEIMQQLTQVIFSVTLLPFILSHRLPPWQNTPMSGAFNTEKNLFGEPLKIVEMQK